MNREQKEEWVGVGVSGGVMGAGRSVQQHGSLHFFDLLILYFALQKCKVRPLDGPMATSNCYLCRQRLLCQ